MRLVAFGLAVCMCSALSAQDNQRPDRKTFSIDDLTWMSGTWLKAEEGNTSEEVWLAPRGGMMVGANRSVRNDGRASHEFLRIVENDGNVTYLASPGGREPTPFTLIACAANKAVFENKDHDFPQQIIYTREGDQLTARIEGEVDGETRSMEWTWQRFGSSRPDKQTMLLGLRTVVYKVDDIERAKVWYAEATGIQPYFDEPFYVGFNIGGFELGLDPDMEGVTRGNNQPAYWGVDDCREAYGKLLERGAKKHTEPQDVGSGIVVATVLDPFGNVFGIIENPHFSLAEGE